MKKNLRLLCLGLAAAAFTSGIAQEAQDLTSLLKNPTMEKSVRGWSVSGKTPMKPGNKNTGTSHFGFHGMSSSIYEAWLGKAQVEGTGKNGIPVEYYWPKLSSGYIMQRLGASEGEGKLANGTYVFGAYVGASCQGDSLPDSYKSITGVKIFANDAEVPVATNNPESKGLPQWAHTSKFNVAVTLTDQDEKPGYLDVGLEIDGTNANYVVWDNATLYYFGDMSEEQALDEMAKIDFRHTVYDIVDTLFTEASRDTLVLNVDTLAEFDAALAAAKLAIEEGSVTAANLWDLNEKIYYHKGLAHKSIQDYTNLKNDLKNAQKILDNPEAWQNFDDGEGATLGAAFLELYLMPAVEEANAAYEAREMNRKELEDLRKVVNYAVGYVKLDSILTVQQELHDFIAYVEANPDLYTNIQKRELQNLDGEVQDTIDAVSAEIEMETSEKTINPNDIYPYVARMLDAMQNVKDNQMDEDYTEFPIEFKAGSNGWVEGTKDVDASKNIVGYTSPMYRFPGKVDKFRITVNKVKSGEKFFCLSGLEFYDGDGNLIPLTEANVTTNADHNSLNSTPDGDGLPALFDGEDETYFHSAHSNGPAEAHYLEITLPGGGYEMFSFKMVGRANNGYNQDHTFPAEMVLATPTPERDAMKNQLETLKNLHAYSVYQVKNEVGFYNSDFKYILDVIAEADTLLAHHPSESQCAAMASRLTAATNQFTNAPDKSVNLPEDGKVYWIVSALPGFNTNQQVDKALTIGADSTIVWETASIDSLKQKFVFEQVFNEDDEPSVEMDASGSQVLYYHYYIKNVATGQYISRNFTNESSDNDRRVKLVDTPDTIRLRSFGAGQWGLSLWKEVKKDNQTVKELTYMDMYGNGGGGGKNGHIGPYGASYNSGGSFFIREYSELPVTVEVKAGDFKSQCYHFTPGNNIMLTADADCAFENLALYSLLGEPIEVDTIMYSGNTARIVTPKDIVECGFGFTVPAGVSKVTLSAWHYVSKLPDLVAAYEAAVENGPIVGDSIGQYKDVASYLAIIEEAEALIEDAITMPEDEESSKAFDAMIKKLEKATDGLERNLPEEGKYYYIMNALSAFEKENYEMTLYVDGTNLAWGGINDVSWNRYWQFERATKTELQAIEYPDSVDAFYIKNLGSGEYIGGFSTQNTEQGNWKNDADIPMAESKADALPYVLTSLDGGSIIAFDTWDKVSKNFRSRLHAKGHGSGKNTTGGITYWGSGLESSSSWRIVEVQYDATDIDFTEVETEQPVVKGIYDIYGRRVVAPTAPGLYIIDGKKRYIK